MRKIFAAVAAMAAALMAASCREQSPDSYLPPEFGPVEVSLNGFSATAQCKVTGPEDGFSYGFVLQEGSGAQPQEIALKPYEGVLSSVFEELTPSTDYIIKAFATNGINTVTSAEHSFRTAKEEDVTPTVSIPDPAFRKYILSKFDRDNDGRLSQDEAEGISEIECCTDDIRSIEGVECFSSLERLICRGSGTDSGHRTGLLTKIDLSHNYRLRYIEVDGNNLTELILPDKSSNIDDIHCILNKLKSLDVSKCPKLKTLWCWENDLSSLDLSNNQLLKDLRCALNNFSEGLDVSSNKELRYLYCDGSFMPSIDVSENIELIELGCWDNAIKAIDVSHNPELSVLECANNLLKTIDISQNPLLSKFTCEDNYLKEIDVSHNPELRTFNCWNNQLSSIDISMLTHLENLSIGDNNITEPVDLSIFPDLTDYGGNNLPLSRIPDFSHNPKLQSLHLCGSGGAIYMDEGFFRQWPEIKDFNIGGYPGESIDLSLNTKMETLWMGDMTNVKVLDLSASPHLRFIWLNGCSKLETVYLHKDVDISRLEINKEGTHDAKIEFK